MDKDRGITGATEGDGGGDGGGGIWLQVGDSGGFVFSFDEHLSDIFSSLQ